MDDKMTLYRKGRCPLDPPLAPGLPTLAAYETFFWFCVYSNVRERRRRPRSSHFSTALHDRLEAAQVSAAAARPRRGAERF